MTHLTVDRQSICGELDATKQRSSTKEHLPTARIRNYCLNRLERLGTQRISRNVGGLKSKMSCSRQDKSLIRNPFDRAEEKSNTLLETHPSRPYLF